MHDLTLLLAAIAVILLAFQAKPRRKPNITNTSRTRFSEADIAVFVFVSVLVVIITMMVWAR
jgi:hypothetical protein